MYDILGHKFFECREFEKESGKSGTLVMVNEVIISWPMMQRADFSHKSIDLCVHRKPQ